MYCVLETGVVFSEISLEILKVKQQTNQTGKKKPVNAEAHMKWNSNSVLAVVKYVFAETLKNYLSQPCTQNSHSVSLLLVVLMLGTK